MSELPKWWRHDAKGAPGRFQITVDGDAYGFTKDREARLFFALIECKTQKVATFRDTRARR